jgi:diketogulonate reductase-like aldo/keto reductase
MSVNAIKLGIDVGFCHFDSAYIYDNEKEVGVAIQSKIADGTVKREDIFVTSKVLSIWCAGVKISGI